MMADLLMYEAYCNAANIFLAALVATGVALEIFGDRDSEGGKRIAKIGFFLLVIALFAEVITSWKEREIGGKIRDDLMTRIAMLEDHTKISVPQKKGTPSQ